MLVNVVKSDYSDIKNITDVPDSFNEAKNPLYLGAREGQVKRVRKKGKGFACGVWELGEFGLLTPTGELDNTLWERHDAVFAADPQRVPEKFRATYEKLLWKLKAL